MAPATVDRASLHSFRPTGETMIHWVLKHLYPRLRKAVDKWFEDDGNMLAASTAYYSALSIFPIMLLLISVLGFVLEFSSAAQGAQAELLEVVAENTSPQLAEHVATAMSNVRRKAAVGGPLGIAVLIVTAIGVFMQFEAAMDRIWNVESPSHGFMVMVRQLLFQRLKAFLMLLAMGVFVVLLFLASMTLSAVREYLPDLPGTTFGWVVLQTAVTVAGYWLIFSTIYWSLSKAPVRWREAAQGGLIAAILWEVSRQLLAAFLVGERYSAYGVVGSMIILMLWIYFAASVIYFGAEYVQVICKECENTAPPGKQPDTEEVETNPG